MEISLEAAVSEERGTARLTLPLSVRITAAGQRKERG
jgi:hypothetical protein